MKNLLTILFACTIAQAIESVRPGAVWNLRGATYEGIEWLDDAQTKPTRGQIVTALATCEDTDGAREQQKRAARFTVRLSTATPTQKVNALILLLDMDK